MFPVKLQINIQINNFFIISHHNQTHNRQTEPAVRSVSSPVTLSNRVRAIFPPRPRQAQSASQFPVTHKRGSTRKSSVSSSYPGSTRSASTISRSTRTTGSSSVSSSTRPSLTSRGRASSSHTYQHNVKASRVKAPSSVYTGSSSSSCRTFTFDSSTTRNAAVAKSALPGRR